MSHFHFHVELHIFVPYYVMFCMYVFLFPQKGDVSLKINEKGCLQAGDEWLTKNLIPIAGVAVGIAFLQVCWFFPLKSKKKITSLIIFVTF